MDSMLNSETGGAKVLMALVAGGAVTLAASGICWFCHSDLAGGASLSPHSLHAAGVGLVAGIPLAASRLLFWSDGAREVVPSLDDLQRGKLEYFKPLLSNMTAAQVCINCT